MADGRHGARRAAVAALPDAVGGVLRHPGRRAGSAPAPANPFRRGRPLGGPALDVADVIVGEAAALPGMTLVVVGDPRWVSTRELLATAWRRKPARCVLAPSGPLPLREESLRAVPLFSGRETVPAGRARAYLCEGGACRIPVEEPAALARLLATVAG